jgi:subfamily B ATP-binding cassette protein MsbA
LFNKILRLPLSYFSEEKKGDLMSRITADVQEIEWSILNVLEAVFREPILIIGSLSYMLYISPQFTLFAFGMILLVALVVGTISKTLRKQSGEAQKRLGGVTSIIEESLGGLRVIKGFNAESYQQNKFNTENGAFKKTLISILRRKDLSSPLSEWLGVSIVSMLIVYGSGLVFKGEMQASSFMAFLFAFFRVIDPAKSLSNAWSNIQKGFAAMERIDSIMQAEESIQDLPGAKEIREFKSKIEFKNVSFNYKNSEIEVLQEINFVLQQGKSIALVGASGSGKSTLLDLIPRFQDATKGSITIDGQDIRNFKIYDLRDLMGIVTQDAILFNDTIYNNIVFGQKDISPEQVIAAAKTANAHQFIMAMDGDYKANVGDRGSKLSGGQRQRITIARAVLKNPPILLLDEATSALDSESEKLVQQALNGLMKNRTSLIIAHRLSTIMEADEILVMNGGCIIERGTHAQLLSQKGEYYSLVQLQSF